MGLSSGFHLQNWEQNLNKGNFVGPTHTEWVNNSEGGN